MGDWAQLALELTNQQEPVDFEEAHLGGNSRVQLETRLGLTQGASWCEWRQLASPHLTSRQHYVAK